MDSTAKFMIIIGVCLVLLGIVWQFFGKNIPLGKLPGDIMIDKGNFKVFFPITTSILISLSVFIIYTLYKFIFP